MISFGNWKLFKTQVGNWKLFETQADDQVTLQYPTIYSRYSVIYHENLYKESTCMFRSGLTI